MIFEKNRTLNEILHMEQSLVLCSSPRGGGQMSAGKLSPRGGVGVACQPPDVELGSCMLGMY